ncbi:hypothetical protein FQR65_LT08413 [Abscondita terminalis]|nr:hypothetical protein FQR65_LT09522 [Abscondita terminalis]KAF5303082.1 hypothetical protein FQR65_LT08413 [Abscondita terminalis]
MGRKTNEGKVLRLSTRRKNRRLAILRALKKKENLTATHVEENKSECSKQFPQRILMETQNIPTCEDPKPSCSKDVELEISFSNPNNRDTPPSCSTLQYETDHYSEKEESVSQQ